MKPDPSGSCIHARGVRVNNLKNIEVRIPHGKFTVITGVSGSGKSSLAFDTIYAEGQRRYVESLSTYARQFMGRMRKPECDLIEGIPPAVAITQRAASAGPRSTVGTSTEILDYLRMLFARVGRTFSPVSGREVRKHTTDDVIRAMLSRPEGTPVYVLAPLIARAGRTMAEQLDIYLKSGFLRVMANGKPTLISDLTAHAGAHALPIVRHPDGTNAQRVGWPDGGPNEQREECGLARTLPSREGGTRSDNGGRVGPLVIDRLKASGDSDTRRRLADSVQTAMREGDGRCSLLFANSGEQEDFSLLFEADGMRFDEPTDQLFSFNSPAGACPQCEGYGRVIGIDESLVVPDSSLSIHGGAVACWRGEKMGEWRKEFVRRAESLGVRVHTPYSDLTPREKDILWHASPRAGRTGNPDGGAGDRVGSPCIDAFFQMLQENQYKIQYRVMLARYRGKTTCPSCLGSRLRPEAGYVRVGGQTITQLCDLSIAELRGFFADLTLDERETKVARRLLSEITSRLQFLLDVGLGYLTLSRLTSSLSGGEVRRVRLATSLGSSLVGSAYILDEPSAGLHPRDTQRLIAALRQLQQLGNTVIAVEHDEEIMRAADHLIDIGPDAGRLGGQVVYEGPATPAHALGVIRHPDGGPNEQREECGLARTLPSREGGKRSEYRGARGFPWASSHTLALLTGAERIPAPVTRRPWNRRIIVRGARAHNLCGIDAVFPLNVMTCVTGVSGSGKSSLVRDILYNALRQPQGGAWTGLCDGVEGDLDMVRQVDFVDQKPLSTSSRSNPATQCGAWDEIRRLLASQPLARQMGYTPARFSFNTEGGRCEACKGEGHVTVDMQFMSDVTIECDECHGRRFKSDTLDVTYRGKNAADLLEMTVAEAADLFADDTSRVVSCLRPLLDVGLGYLQLGQPTSTLSGGECQRLKLASWLSADRTEPTLFIFDEPTTGLHSHDIARLLDAFSALIARGHTVIVIEHHMDVIKCADHVIDLGPEAGPDGGHIVATGTPEEIAAGDGHTALFLRNALHQAASPSAESSPSHLK